MPFNQSNPFEVFKQWYSQAERKGLSRWILSWMYPPALFHQPQSMTLATATRDGKPSVRIVLFKGLNKKGITFYTNYQSRKGLELDSNPYAALNFHWGFPERQVRVEGLVTRLSHEESSLYWKSRPRGSQLSAWASPQSQPIKDYASFCLNVQALKEKYQGIEIPCPDFWGGYVLEPHQFEFWEFRLNRMHQRICYTYQSGEWKQFGLAP
jgi:pyridoxamine 5'-phosphate oxidase